DDPNTGELVRHSKETARELHGRADAALQALLRDLHQAGIHVCSLERPRSGRAGILPQGLPRVDPSDARSSRAGRAPVAVRLGRGTEHRRLAQARESGKRYLSVLTIPSLSPGLV